MRSRVEFAVALVLQVIAAGGALLMSTRDWQTITVPRARPLADDVLSINGRTVDAAPTALALVALAGVVAVIATRGLARRVVGGVVALAGAGLVVRAGAAGSAVSPARARDLVRSRHSGVGVDPGVHPSVVVHGVWPALTVVCGILVVVAGVLIALRGHRWQGLSARYQAPAAGADAASGVPPVPPVPPVPLSAEERDRQRTRASVALWSALDRGEDPTGPEGADGATDRP